MLDFLNMCKSFVRVVILDFNIAGLPGIFWDGGSLGPLKLPLRIIEQVCTLAEPACS